MFKEENSKKQTYIQMKPNLHFQMEYGTVRKKTGAGHFSPV